MLCTNPVTFPRKLSDIIVLAFVIAVPLAWYTMHSWLQNFAYRTGISSWMFILTGLGVLILAVVTASGVIIRAARTNPAESLRYEDEA